MLSDPRSRGRRLVLEGIRHAGRIARVDLARATGISQATVTAITAELLDEGLITEIPRPHDFAQGARRGRPRIDLELDGTAFVVAGIKIAERAVSVVLLDFAGAQLGDATLPLSGAPMTPEDLGALVSRAITAGAAAANIAPEAVSGIGLGLAGLVDVTSGHVHWSPWLTRRNVALRDMLEADLGRPVFIDNDANLVALAEQYFGLGRDVTDFIVVTIESGVGMGIVLNGEIYRGTRGCGAEFGHTKVQLDGALCRCGQRGCLEAYVADYALLREAAIAAPPQTDAPHTDPQRSSEERLTALMEAARAGERTATSILNRAARMFAMGLANLVNVFDPQLIILSGEQMRFDFLFADRVLDSIRDQIVMIDAEPPQVVIHKWGDLMWAKGAAAYALSGVADRALRDLGGQRAAGTPASDSQTKRLM